MVSGLSHITLVVSDLDRMSKFLVNIFDAKEVYSSGESTFSISKERFFIVSDTWLAIMKGESMTQKTYNHIAFKINEDDFDEFERRVDSFGVEIRKGRERVRGEGRSLYFYDFDNHLFELHTGTLKQRLERYQA